MGRRSRALAPAACVFVIVVLSSSQNPRQGRRRVETRNRRTALEISGSGSNPSLITHPPRPSWTWTPWPSTNPIPLPDPQASGIPTSLLSSSRGGVWVLLPPFEVYVDLISLGVIGIIRQIAFPLSPSPPYWSAPVIPTGPRRAKGNPSIREGASSALSWFPWYSAAPLGLLGHNQVQLPLWTG